MADVDCEPNFFAKDTWTPRSPGINPAIEYTPDLDISAFSPKHGDVFRVFIDEQYISYHHKPVAEHKCFGSGRYAPCSDISALVMHHGCLFVNQKLKNASHRRFCSVENSFELSINPDMVYPKLIKVVDFPLDLRVRGVVVGILIDHPPEEWVSTVHNGYRSSELDAKFKFSLRVLDYNVLTNYDPMPMVVDRTEYVPEKTALPVYKLTARMEVGLAYSPMMFQQVFSRFNIAKGMLNLFRLVLEAGDHRYEIAYVDEKEFSLIEEQGATQIQLLSELDMSEFHVDGDVLRVRDARIGPISTILLLDREEPRPSDSA